MGRPLPLVNEQLCPDFNTTFIKNIKKLSKKISSNKMFIKIVYKPILFRKSVKWVLTSWPNWMSNNIVGWSKLNCLLCYCYRRHDLEWVIIYIYIWICLHSWNLIFTFFFFFCLSTKKFTLFFLKGSLINHKSTVKLIIFLSTPPFLFIIYDFVHIKMFYRNNINFPLCFTYHFKQ